MIAPARRAALQALSAVDRGAELPVALARTRDELADERDRALAAAIVTGTLRWRSRLDFLIEQHASRPAASARRPAKVGAPGASAVRTPLASS